MSTAIMRFERTIFATINGALNHVAKHEKIKSVLHKLVAFEISLSIVSLAIERLNEIEQSKVTSTIRSSLYCLLQLSIAWQHTVLSGFTFFENQNMHHNFF